MTSDDRFERLLADVLADMAPGREPDRLVPGILRAARRGHRRPRWLALLKEPPMRIHHRVAVGSPTVRLIGVMALTMALALATAGAVAVGASLLPTPPKPPPFGTAVTGDMYYSEDGDIIRADPDGSNPVAIVKGPTTDQFPGLSRDGTHMIFLRGEGEGDGQVVHAILADADGIVVRDLGAVTDRFTWFDWSPDDSVLAVCCDGGTIGTMTLDGVRTPIDLGGLEPVAFVAWRPTEGRELIFHAHPEAGSPDIGLYAIAPDGTGLRQIGELDTDTGGDTHLAFTTLQLSTDGVTAAYWDWEPDSSGDGAGPFLHLLDLDTGEQLPVPFGPADGHGVEPQISPDGEWVVFEGDSTSTPGMSSLLYAPMDGSGPAREIGPAYDYTWRLGKSFLPDGKQVLLAMVPDDVHPSVIIDVETGETVTELEDVHDEDRTWQRLAP